MLRRVAARSWPGSCRRGAAIPFVSTVTGRLGRRRRDLDAGVLGTASLRQPVRFADGRATRCRRRASPAFVEVEPAPGAVPRRCRTTPGRRRGRHRGRAHAAPRRRRPRRGCSTALAAAARHGASPSTGGRASPAPAPAASTCRPTPSSGSGTGWTTADAGAGTAADASTPGSGRRSSGRTPERSPPARASRRPSRWPRSCPRCRRGAAGASSPLVDGWRYRVVWKPRADPAPVELAGRWLLVVAGRASRPTLEASHAALADRGAEVARDGPGAAGRTLDRASWPRRRRRRAGRRRAVAARLDETPVPAPTRCPRASPRLWRWSRRWATPASARRCGA